MLLGIHSVAGVENIVGIGEAVSQKGIYCKMKLFFLYASDFR